MNWWKRRVPEAQLPGPPAEKGLREAKAAVAAANARWARVRQVERAAQEQLEMNHFAEILGNAFKGTP